MSDPQTGFVDAWLDPALRSMGKLARLSEIVDWSRIEALAVPLRNGEHGRPPYPPGAMLRALYLQALYDLSDPGLEDNLRHRSDFRAFCGFALDRATPDETTLCRFRIAVAEAGVMQALLEEVNRQLDAKGLVLRKGTLIDATIVAAASRRPAHEAGPNAEARREPEARFTRKGNRTYFGWRLHVGVDQGSGLLRGAIVTPADVNESSVADALIAGDERAVYADRGYENKHRRKALKRRGIKDRIMHRSHKHQTGLPRWQKRRNRLIARIRAPVEAVFGTMKRSYRRARSRYCGLVRTTADLLRVITVYNLRRAIVLSTP
jgi:IS5 family transposase